MTCTQADAACPFVRGASMRIAVPYEDPKQADGTPEEAAAYDERTVQIATEMLYLFRKVALLSS
jgi:arsenate reductase (thioredoxin)